MIGAVAVASLLYVIFIGVRFHIENERAKEERCSANLRAIGSVVPLYVNECGRYPADLKTLANSQGFGDPDLGSPGRPKAPSTVPGEWYGYVLVDWSAQPRGPDWHWGQYPLIYDASMDNHNGRGIHIVIVNGTVQWDPGAGWLKQFAAKHPTDKLVIPK